ncbi:DNA-directed RNA polymerase subunit alpha [Chelativorans sp. Marseille-P2723]|uniref:DNA-directed RNA polymerase subunit alpha n=1 Tax=Chelativorans sp. Marseille-P2723 TaxID=2709133 RepID=UPI00156FADD5|nr:DNA-directed RNA polymerase subunit alpha [Chelativorans sp. Marseille-P2723]
MFQKHWQELIKPNKPEIRSDNNSTTLIVEPLERGFGFTLGHALRRILLSSLDGAAVTSLRLQGGPLSLASPKDRNEAVTDLILNIKDIALRMEADMPPTQVTLRKEGPGTVLAGDLQTAAGIEVVNPEHQLCTLDAGNDIELDLTVAHGTGYRAAGSIVLEEWNGSEPVSIDAIFSPIRQVKINVENTRQGQVLDYDRLIMTVVTDGTISGEDAVNRAAHIFHDQLSVFINFEEVQPEIPEPEEELPFNPILLKKMEDFELSVRASNCMKNDNIIYVGDLVTMTEAQLLRVPNFGRKSLNEIKTLLAEMGLQLGMELPDWPPADLEEMAEKYAKEAD